MSVSSPSEIVVSAGRLDQGKSRDGKEEAMHAHEPQEVNYILDWQTGLGHHGCVMGKKKSALVITESENEKVVDAQNVSNCWFLCMNGRCARLRKITQDRRRRLLSIQERIIWRVPNW